MWGWTPLVAAIRRHKVGLARAGALAVLAVAAVVVFPKVWANTVPDRGVIAEWNDAIFRLGIDPVFPPEEDVYVGDLLAVITRDRRSEGPRTRDQPFLNRAIKIYHIDMRRELEETYGMVPTFTETGKRPASNDEPWTTTPAPDLFAPAAKRPYLAIAAFPGFTIRHERAAEGGLAAWGAGLFGSAVAESDLIEVKIPFAETYGVPSVIAAGKLAQFCQDPYTAEYCSDRMLRRHLSYVAGPVDFKAIDPDTGKPYYLVDVELALVNRVYLTRSIEQTRTLGSSRGAKVEARAPAAGSAGDAGVPVVAAEEGGASVGDREAEAPDGSGDAAEARTERMLAEIDRRVEHLTERLDAGSAGGTARISADADSRYELKQTFQRPVVIGYRAVRSSFPTNLDLPVEAAPPVPAGEEEEAIPLAGR